MAKKKAVDPELQQVAARLIGELEARRIQADGAYPATLGRLAELAGETAGRAVEAAAAKAFPSEVVIKLTNRKATAESLVHFKDHPPAKASKRAPVPKAPKVEPAELAGRMLAVLEAQRRLGAGSYPTTVRRLVELSGAKASGPLVTKAVGHEALTAKAAVVGTKKPALDNLILLRADCEALVPAVVSGLIAFALEIEAEAASKPAGKGKKPVGVNHAFAATALAKRLGKAWEGPVGSALREGVEGEALPGGVAWILIKGEPHFFKLENVRGTDGDRGESVIPAASPTEPSAPASGGGFAEAFRVAFDRLDRHYGATNFVKLGDLRLGLPEFDREAFDAGLRQLRLSGEFALDSHEGLTGPLAPEDRAAAVVEAGSILVYASRR